jgi:hypothetical protein
MPQPSLASDVRVKEEFGLSILLHLEKAPKLKKG